MGRSCSRIQSLALSPIALFGAPALNVPVASFFIVAKSDLSFSRISRTNARFLSGMLLRPNASAMPQSASWALPFGDILVKIFA